MSTIVLNPVRDGYLYSYSTDYAEAQAGTNLSRSSSGATLYSAQRFFGGTTYRCYETFVAYQMPVELIGATRNSAILSLPVSTDGTTTDVTMEARLCPFATLETGDWVAAEDLGSHELLATLDTTGLGADATFASEDAMLDNLPQFGAIELVITSENMRLGTAPTGDEYLIFKALEDGTNMPTLTIDYDAATPVHGDTARVLTTDAEASYVRSRVAAEKNPEYSAWLELLGSDNLTNAMAFTPAAGNTNYTRTDYICAALDTASRYARNAATAYMCTGTASYAEQAHDILMYWVDNAGDPPSYDGGTYTYNYGFHMSWGCYAFALAYDLTRDSGYYDEGDVTDLTAWFDAWAAAEKSYMLQWVSQEAYAFSQTTLTQAYEWDSNPLSLTNNILDRYTAMDNPAGIVHAWLAACCVAGLTSDLDDCLFNSEFPVNVAVQQQRATSPRNDGDGVAGHPNPVPCVQIYKASYATTPPGCTTYLSFNGRFHTLIYKMAKNLGRDLASQRTGLTAYWDYMCRYAGDDAETPPQGAGDVYDMDYLMSCLQLAIHAVRHAAAREEILSYGAYDLYESQSSGYVLLTAPRVALSQSGADVIISERTVETSDADTIIASDRLSVADADDIIDDRD